MEICRLILSPVGLRYFLLATTHTATASFSFGRIPGESQVPYADSFQRTTGTFSRYSASQLEQIVVRVALVVVDPFLHLKDVDWEDAGLAVAQARVGGQQNVLDDHPAAMFGSMPEAN